MSYATTSIGPGNTGYKVTDPNFPALIAQKCLGDSPRYMCMRTEDAAFILEAIIEFGKVLWLIIGQQHIYTTKLAGVDHLAKCIYYMASYVYTEANSPISKVNYNPSDRDTIFEGSGPISDSFSYSTDQDMKADYKNIYGMNSNPYSLIDLIPSEINSQFKLYTAPWRIDIIVDIYKFIKRIHKMGFIITTSLFDTSTIPYVETRYESYTKKIVNQATGYQEYLDNGGRIFVQTDIPETSQVIHQSSHRWRCNKRYIVDTKRVRGRVKNTDTDKYIYQTSDLEISKVCYIEMSDNYNSTVMLLPLPRIQSENQITSVKAAIELMAYFTTEVAGVSSYSYRYKTIFQDLTISNSAEQDDRYCSATLSLNTESLFNKMASGITYPEPPDPGYGSGETWTMTSRSRNECQVSIHAIRLIFSPPTYNATFSDET